MPTEKRPAHFWEKRTVAAKPKPTVTKPAPKPTTTKPKAAVEPGIKIERIATGVPSESP